VASKEVFIFAGNFSRVSGGIRQHPFMARRQNAVVVAHNGVHQAFQIAQAAQEAGLLETFYTSIFDAPGKWGGRVAQWVGHDALSSRRTDGLDPSRVVEHPWPEVKSRLRRFFYPQALNGAMFAAHEFDLWVSKQLRRSSGQIFVGVENGAFHSFPVAKERGMKLLYDCPGYNARQTQAAAEKTARHFGLAMVDTGDTPEMAHRKEIEISLADCVLCCSEVHAESLRPLGATAEKTAINPLWIDSSRWFPRQPEKAPRQGKLRVVYAGKITLRKGIPFLLEAARALGQDVALTLVGEITTDVLPLLRKPEPFLTVKPPVSKPALRQIYWENDLLVLPSLGDSFGYVALEAMACAKPVIVTDHCGVPLPDPSWRVPVMNSEAIAQRLNHYLANRTALEQDGRVAAEFARQFTPGQYRNGIKILLTRLLRQGNGANPGSPC
jgi:glycosyltransferase involved in cell wall biosynthesis